MQYSDLTTQLGDLLQYPITSASSATPSSDVNFNNILPAIITDAEQRIYRELDFLATRKADSSLSFTPSSRTLTIPTTIIIVQQVNVITPAATQPNSGTRNPVDPVSLESLNFTWPVAAVQSTPSIPTVGSMQDATTLIVAPTPDAAYVVEFVGIFRPTAMSSTNISTYLGTNYPDLFLAACMVFATGFQRDFGSQSGDPAMSLSWESLYQERKKSAFPEIQRQKWSSVGWSALQETLANPQRT